MDYANQATIQSTRSPETISDTLSRSLDRIHQLTASIEVAADRVHGVVPVSISEGKVSISAPQPPPSIGNLARRVDDAIGQANMALERLHNGL